MGDNTPPTTAESITVNDNGGIHVPAHVKEALGGCYGQTLKVTVAVQRDLIRSETAFKADIHAGGGITIPAPNRRALGLEAGETVDAEFHAVEDEEESLGDDRGAVEEGPEEDENILDDIESEFEFDNVEESEDEEPSDGSEEEEEGLADLFG